MAALKSLVVCRSSSSNTPLAAEETSIVERTAAPVGVWGGERKLANDGLEVLGERTAESTIRLLRSGRRGECFLGSIREISPRLCVLFVGGGSS